MTALIDAALALLLLAGALFLGSVGLALYKELSKGDKDENNQPPSNPQ